MVLAFVVHPLNPACRLRVAVDENEAVDHGRPSMGEADEDVGAETHRDADEVGDAVVVADVFNLSKIVESESYFSTCFLHCRSHYWLFTLILSFFHFFSHLS